MVKQRRPVLIAAAGLLLAGAVLLWTRGAATSSVPPPALPQRATALVDQPPRIDLVRLSAPRAGTPAGRRDVFNYDTRPVPGTATPPPPPPTMAAATPPPVYAPPPPSVPPLNVKYIGSVENKLGLRVAIMMTDRKEILTGQTGEVVANRFKIVKIGYESVDIQDLGSDRVRRIPFKGN